jgi:DNA-binding transcriptional regulator YhcF (GntR family)
MDEFDLKREVTDKYSLRGRVFSKIRDDILSGRYKEHEELKEIKIGKELGVSRTPVREALRQLELEGLVQIIPNRGAFVTGIHAKDVKDIYMIRSRLEALCARWATQYITKEQMAALLSENAARLFGMYPQKGVLAEGSDADIVIFDPNDPHTISYKTNLHNCDNSPYEGMTAGGRARDVLLGGELVVERGKLIKPYCGRYVFRGRSARTRK